MFCAEAAAFGQITVGDDDPEAMLRDDGGYRRI